MRFLPKCYLFSLGWSCGFGTPSLGSTSIAMSGTYCIKLGLLVAVLYPIPLCMQNRIGTLLF